VIYTENVRSFDYVVIGVGIKTRIIKIISTNFIKKEISLRKHCHPRIPRVRGKESEKNCLDTWESQDGKSVHHRTHTLICTRAL